MLAIIAFLLADCLLDGWALNFLTTIAVFLVAVPALRTMVSQTALERVTFLKAYVKTRKVQRVAIVLFWIHAIRFLLAAAVDANLLYLAGHTPSLSGAFLAGSQAFEFFAFLASPVLIYLGACMTAIFLRSRLKATKEDPDLIKQRQKLAGASHVLFTSGFIASILSITCSRDGPAYMISNWLLASARDANIYGQPSSGEMIYAQITNPGCYGSGAAPVLYSVTQSLCDYSFVTTFDAIIIGVSSIILLLVLWQPTMRLHALLTSFCWRVISPGSLQNMIEAFLEALHLPGRNLDFRQAHPLVGNAIATTVWLAVCYFSLFWLFGFCGGPLGEAIQNWMIASALDAGIGTSYAVPDWLLHPNYRIFIASMIALYGTPILAVFNCVFLPYAKARKIVINADGISFAQGPYLSLLGRQFRLWSDLESLTVKNNNPDHPKKAKFTLKFRSGGKVEFDHSQINGLDLRILLEAIDEHSVSCTIAAEVFKTVEALAQEDIRKSSSDGGVDSSMASPKALEFKSTIFIPHASGEYIPGTKTRISRQVASKPLCAVYLARDEQGRMVNVKQFYLADQTEQTRAFAKILRRECELLSRLDHPGFARVLDCFTVEDSTYLVIQHRPGSDLRALVNQHGPRS
ncbi:MAG: hypothetical protein K8F91_00685, partial [Candidatus Obscuribacterales bacterium]|nr:hypothetical protein [Candidatus Obscuribacterales bacterium]